MKHVVDKKRRAEQFESGDDVALSTENLRAYCPRLPSEIRHVGWAPFISRKQCHQLLADWISPQVGGSIPSSMLASANAISTRRYSWGRSSRRFLYWWGILWSMKLRGFSGISALVPAVSIWGRGKSVHSLRLSRSLNPTWIMLEIFWRNTCAE